MSINHHPLSDICSRLAEVAAEHPDRVALRFLHGGDAGPVEWTYARLLAGVERVAAPLADRYGLGQRALLLLPSGPDLVVALFGCVRAGLIAVPAPLPASGRPARYAGRIAALVADCRPVVALTRVPGTAWATMLPDGVEVLELDALPAPPAAPTPRLDVNSVAYLQYSSGSTGSPKAVTNTHRALRYQVEMISALWPGPEPPHMAGWLPLYHDMGLILQMLVPLLTGGTSTFMAPSSFAADPARWLRAVATYRANGIAGPDFAYQRCCDAIAPAEVLTLDLSAVRYAGNGAEPVRPDTLQRFADHFAPAGLRREAITPVYGLAEAGLCVSTSRHPRGWLVSHYDTAALAAGQARPTAPGAGRALVSCGNWFHEWDVRVVDPGRGRELAERQIGEVWVGGGALPAGYWNRPQQTEETFEAQLKDGSGPWLRTGDLGFLDGGELYLCGRRKDLIIVHGANHHPSDIERTVEQAIDGVQVGGVCAVQHGDDHAVLIVAEVERRMPEGRLAETSAAIRAAVHEAHEIVADDVALVRRPGIPRTTSGKVRRAATAAAYTAGELPVLHADRLTAPPEPPSAPAPAARPPLPPGAVLGVLHDGLCALLGRSSVPLDTGFASLGLDSLAITRWAHQLTELLGRPVPVTLLYRHPSLRRLAGALDGSPASAGAAAGRPGAAAHDTAVAVIGVGLQLPRGTDSLDALAALLLEAGTLLGPPPAARARDGVPLTVPGAYLAAVDEFDAELFGISRAEAQAMDPQQRLLLQVAWRAWEDAGLVASSPAVRGRRIGVFVGQGHHEYAMLPLRLGHPEWIRAFHPTGTSMSAAAGRIAHHFGLRGPALVIDTACSASLVAIDTACRHLADGTCELALAGGVNVALSPETEQALRAAGMLSPAGRCATLSADADGYGRGEGAALLVLKPLAAARRDGDRILAVIRGSAVAQDGASSGLSVPNPAAQAEVIRAALAAAGLAPDDIDAVELHGTGTPLGDPIEVAALAEVHAGRTRPLYLGSVKTNLGHLEAAAGVAGVLRALVALRHQAWPGSPTFTGPNPALAGIGLPYRFPTRTEAIPSQAPLRRIGVSSFGFTGTIAHLVLEAAGADPAPAAADWVGWVPVAAASPAALRRRAAKLRETLAGRERADQARVLAGWRRHRDHLMTWRTVVSGADAGGLAAALADPPDPHDASSPGPVVLRLRPDDPVAALVEALCAWLPPWLSPSPEAPPQRRLLDALGSLGLKPDRLDLEPGPDAATGLVLGVGDEDTPNVVTLRVADGGRSGLAEAYRRGAALDWAALDPPSPDAAERRLPGYPFEATRHWYPVPDADADATTAAVPDDAPFTLEQMRADVAAMLDRSADGLGDGEDLVAAGLDSIRLTDLAALWGRHGVVLSLAEMFAHPTLAAWWQRAAGAPAAAPALGATVDDAAPFPLTPVQHAYWVGRDPRQPLGGVGCHVYAELDGMGVDPGRLERAVCALFERHGMLRAIFDGEGRQRILPASPWRGLTVHDLRQAEAAGIGEALEAIRRGLSHRLLAVDQGEVLDLQLSLLPDDETRIHVNVDMLVADALSLQILLADLAALYTDPHRALPAISTSFPRHLAARAERQAAAHERGREYWRRRLADLPAPPQLPLAAVVPPGPPRFVRFQHRLAPPAWRALAQRARRHGLTPSVALAAAFSQVLAAWSEQPRLRLMLTLFDREDLHPDTALLVADFTSLVLLAVEANAADGFAARAQNLQRQLREDLDHAAYSGVEVLRDLARTAGREAATAPVVFTSNLGRDLLAPQIRDTFGELGWSLSQTPQVWLDHQVMEQDGGLLLTWDAVPDVFRPGVLESMFDAYRGLLDSLASGTWSRQVPALPPASQMEVRRRVNATESEASGRRLHEAFFDQAAKVPEGTAVRFGEDGCVSYADLADRALRIGGWLRGRGVGAGEAVAVCLPKGVDQIAAVLGVLAAGGVYVPLGVDQPAARREAILSTAGVREVLSAQTFGEAVATPALAAPVTVADTDLAYVIFTSGSTGAPKGVEITHRSAVNTIEDMSARYGVGREDRVLALSALDFDLSVYDIFGLLGAGGTVVCIEEDQRRDAHGWADLVRRHGVTVWNSVPALLDMLLVAATDEDLATLRLAMVSGDWVGLDLHPRLAQRQPQCRLVALGGATEAAIWSNALDLTHVPSHWRSVPYGFPLRNQSYRVADPEGRDRPDWVPGELWIGGLGVARGYRGDPQRTAARFVEHHGQRFYRTGDQGRYWPDGTLEFLGRTDHQVKIRGHRIELGEIEAALHAHPAVTAAVASAAGNRLTAAVTTGPAAAPTAPAEADDAGGLGVVFSTRHRLAADVTEAMLVELLAQMGALAAVTSTPRPLAELAAAAAVAEPMTGLLELWLEWLRGRGVLDREADGWAAGPRLEQAADAEHLALTLLPDGDAVLAAVTARLRSRYRDLVAILRGEQDPAGLLDDPVLAPEALLDAQPHVATALDGLATELAAAAPADRPLRIAELGGRGGLTALRLLGRLDAGRVEYTLLDGSTALLSTARERLAGLPHPVRLQRLGAALDIDLLHAFDVVIANNALHRQPDPAAALAMARLLLAPDGLLAALEATELSPLALLTVAIPERGFARPGGGAARGPLRDGAAWLSLLARAGFSEATASDADEAGAMLWLRARSRGATPALDAPAMSAWLAQRLPSYMIPDRLAVLTDLPLSANGKVDRAAVVRLLAQIQDQASSDSYAEPASAAERLVAGVWAELLGHARVGRDDDFFALGGESLVATRVMARLRAAGAGAHLAQLFTAPRLADFAATLELGPAATAGAAVLAGDPAHRHEPFPPTDVQRAYWMGRGDDFTLGGVATHYYTEFDGPDVDLVRLHEAWDRLIARHEMLRAVFDADGRQRILPEVPPLHIPVVDANGDEQAALDALRGAMSHQVLDATRWPLFDIRAVRYGAGRTRLGLSLDNLILDGLSMRILVTELATLYDDPAAALPPVGVSFRDYVLHAAADPAAVAAAETYWRRRLVELPPPPQLPLRADPATLAAPRFTRREAVLAADDWQRVVQVARGHGLTPSTVLLTCFAEVLATWSTQPELTLNLTLFDRREVHPDINHVLGDFTSLLLLAHQPEPGAGFLARARRLQGQLWADLEHRDVSAVWVLRELVRHHGTGGAAMPVVFTSALGVGDEIAGYQAQRFPPRVWGISQTPQVWLDHQVYEERGALRFNWDAVEELFPAGVLDAMFTAYQAVLARLGVADWSEPLPPLVGADQVEVRRRVNATGAEASGRRLHEAFFDQAAKVPEGTAVRFGEDGCVSYADLADRALRIGGWLRGRGVGAGEAVAVCLPKGVDQIAAVLGVLAAGGVYVPVGVDQPAARREAILSTAGVREVLSAQTFGEAVATPALTAPVTVADTDLAYVIFTSGSTGAPKGVEITHRSAVNTIEDVSARYGVGREDRVLALSALDFDLSVYDIFGLLGAGGTVVCIEEDQRRDAHGWADLVRRHGVTVWNSVPALLDMLLVAATDEDLATLRLAMVSGDWVGLDLHPRLAQRQPQCRLVALGGATEAAIWSNALDLTHVPSHWRSVPYGFPLRNQSYRVADPEGRDRPDWVPGELWIGGLGVARGYRGDPQRTAARFVEHHGQRFYRTGDQGRYWPDGTLEFLGRTDHQVKIRGHRIELGEIEAALHAHPAVTAAVASAAGNRLTAAVTTDGAELDLEEVGRFVAQRLPGYMVPERVVVLEALPLSANGKVDRAALNARLALAAPAADDEPPSGEVEVELARIWAELLGLPAVGRQQSFFGLGGDSLAATRLVEAIRRRFATRLSLRQLYAAPTVSALASRLDAHAVVLEDLEDGTV